MQIFDWSAIFNDPLYDDGSARLALFVDIEYPYRYIWIALIFAIRDYNGLLPETSDSSKTTDELYSVDEATTEENDKSDKVFNTKVQSNVTFTKETNGMLFFYSLLFNSFIGVCNWQFRSSTERAILNFFTL